MVQIDSKYRVLDFDWVVTEAALSQGPRGATTDIFAPAQGFFQVATVSDLEIKVSPPAIVCRTMLLSACMSSRLQTLHTQLY